MASKIDEKVAKGYIHFTSILEIVGKPKEHVDSTFAAYIADMKKNLKYEIVSDTVHEAIPVEGSENLYSAFAEVEVLAKNMGTLYDFCFECMPASVEIVAPAELKLRPNEASAAVNDLIGRIHQVDMQAKKMNQQNAVLASSLRVAIQNGILIYLSHKPHRIESIGTAVGIAPAQLKPLLEGLIKDGKLTFADEHYAIAGAALKKREDAAKSGKKK